MTAHGVNRAELLKELRKQVGILEKDLRQQAAEDEYAVPLRAEYDRAYAAKRLAASYGAWLDGEVAQAAAAWVLATVFVRFCEDNELIEAPFITGPGERFAEAEDRHEEFFATNPTMNDRDWLIRAFNHLAGTHPAVAGLFDERHNPLWELQPSYEAASALLKFWRRRGPDAEVVFDFTDKEHRDTRFLGDLYQDLSEHARKTYALLQTPEFVEEFILDLTLEPAVEEFGLTGLRTIDPACGSGHFLLGIFARLLEKWRKAEPGTDDWVLIRRSMESVHGCDKNPFAASIARFRLLVTALNATDVRLLSAAGEFPINVAVGDSLLHGRGAPGIQQTTDEIQHGVHTYITEDVYDYIQSCHLLDESSYHVVVGNPPYITVKDKQENANYRAYESCSGKYSLSVPFAERLFRLAIRASGSSRSAGYVGQITANSFMKREFGKKLIEVFFPSVHLTHIIDTSGAYIPGHGTPTVILIGRNHISRMADSIRTVLGVRGEPSRPKVPAEGIVWSAIEAQVKQADSESEWITSEDADRRSYHSFPWSVSGGGAGGVFNIVDHDDRDRLKRQISRVGFYGVMGADEIMSAPQPSFARAGVEFEFVRPLAVGDEVRDWDISASWSAFYPYLSDKSLAPLESMPRNAERIWPIRTNLGNRATFTKGTYFGDGRSWYGWHQMPKDVGTSYLAIVFAEVATHNHFVLDRYERVFKQTAPVIKLPEARGEGEHLGLLGVLNSSTACFWLKQVCHCKGSSVDSKGARQTGADWENFYQFNGTKLEQFPLPVRLPLGLGKVLDVLAQDLSRHQPSAVAGRDVPSRKALDSACAEAASIRAQMIAFQEELDWTVYGSYGLLADTEVACTTTVDLDAVPEVQLGERAFEIVLARTVEAGKAWFERHGSTPITEIPAHWPEDYRQTVQARIDLIESRRDLALIERPECKRRWASEPWEKKEKEALQSWLLDRCEREDLWFALRDGDRQPRTLTVSQLADRLSDSDPDVVSVAELYSADHLGKRDAPLAEVIASIVADEHVPYLAAFRYTDSGLRKRAEWEHVWDLQREEDRTGARLDIAVPPKYGKEDFRKNAYWTQRGKLDVPKERFVSYPGASPDADPTLLLGWAGWDHKDQVQALVNLVNDRTDQAGWGADKVKPLLAGIAELLPWVHQWHGEYDADWGGNPAEEYQAYLDGQRGQHQLTSVALTAWRPDPPVRGRRASGK